MYGDRWTYTPTVSFSGGGVTFLVCLLYLKTTIFQALFFILSFFLFFILIIFYYSSFFLFVSFFAFNFGVIFLCFPSA